jgi:hypothetical protein
VIEMYWKLVYVAVNVGVCFIGCVYWKLVYVAVNVGVCFIGCVYWKLLWDSETET